MRLAQCEVSSDWVVNSLLVTCEVSVSEGGGAAVDLTGWGGVY